MGALGNLDHERFCQALHKRLWAGEKRSEALATVYRETMYRGANLNDEAIKPNARRLANTKPIRARLKEMNDYAEKLSGLDKGWALLQLKRQLDEVNLFNLADYLTTREGHVQPDFDLANRSREEMARISELTISYGEQGRSVRLKGPEKHSAVRAIIDSMAKMAGWNAPAKIAPTDAAGDDLTLEKLVLASLAPAEVAA